MMYAVTIRENRQYVVLVEAPDADAALTKAFDKYRSEDLTPDAFDADEGDAEVEPAEEDTEEC
jgi:hypothetical protein